MLGTANHRLSLLLTALTSLGCGFEPVTEGPATCGSKRANQPLQLGVAHAAGDYQPPSTLPFLASGANDASQLGLRTFKAYLSPDYRTKYPQPGWSDVRSLRELAETPQFRELFNGPFETFVLTAYTFSNGTGDLWRTSDDATLFDDERDEIEALAEFLLRTYAGTGKTFVLQNWEGDWALLNGEAAGSQVDAARVKRMHRWLEARQQGVTNARSKASADKVTVLHAAEVNLVLEHSGSRVLDDVLPGLCLDSVSYSAWEALALDVSLPLSTQREQLRHSLTKAIERIRSIVGDVDVSLGELGFAENEHPRHTEALLDEALVTSANLGLSRAIYWQVYDNECDVGACRGLWLVRPDGSWSDAAHRLSKH